MPPALDDDQLLLRDAARDLLAAGCPVALLRAHRDDPAAAGPLWDELRDFVHLGLGPLADLGVFMEELGYVAAPTPFFATACLYAPLLDATGEHDLDPVLDGHASGTVAIADADGRATAVPDAVGVDLVAAVDPRGIVTLLAAPPAERLSSEDSTRLHYTVDTRGAGIPAGRVTADDLTDVLGRARVAFAAETLGTVRRLLDLTGPEPAGELGPALAVARARVAEAASAWDADDAGRRDLTRAAWIATTAVAGATADAADAAGPPDPDADFFVRRVRSAGAAAGPIPPITGAGPGTTI